MARHTSNKMKERDEKPAISVQRKSQNTPAINTLYPPYMSLIRAKVRIVLHNIKERIEAGQKFDAVLSEVSCFVRVGRRAEKPEMRYSCGKSA